MKKTFYGTRTSICPACLRHVPADHVADEQGLFMEKYCPEHGHFKTRIARDHPWHAGLMEYTAASVAPETRQTKIDRGCPYDCGECDAHRQKAAFFLFEITSRCNLCCPICLGSPGPEGRQLTTGDMASMLRTVLAYAGQAPIVTLGGGEPTVHTGFSISSIR